MKYLFTAFVTAMFLVAASASANPIVLSGPGFGTGTAFWQNTSWDRNGQANIGNWIMHSGSSDVPNFYSNSPSIGAVWLGNGLSTFAFDLTTPPTDPATLTHWFSVTGWDDEFGLYNLDNGAKIPIGSAHDRQYASTGLTTALFTPGVWGFYLTSGEGNTWYSGQTSPDGRSHFALFQGATGQNWYLGIEDATFTTPKPADWDYNDVILELVVPQPVPEPGGLSLLAIGLLAIARGVKKWKV